MKARFKPIPKSIAKSELVENEVGLSDFSETGILKLGPRKKYGLHFSFCFLKTKCAIRSRLMGIISYSVFEPSILVKFTLLLLKDNSVFGEIDKNLLIGKSAKTPNLNPKLFDNVALLGSI